MLYIKERNGGVGIAVENIGTPIKFEKEKHNLPLNFKIGGDCDLSIRKLLTSHKDKILITGKIEKGLETEFITGAGIEYGWNEIAFIRVGYQLFGNNEGIKAGCGIRYKNFQVDYAINPYENLGIVHRIGLVVNIENKIKVLSEEKLFRETERGLETRVRNDVLFDFNKAYLKKEAYKALDRILIVLKKYKRLKIRIEGYTDNIGGDKFNLDLSKNRAIAVCEYFKKQGINHERLICVGLGKSHPIASNETEEGKAKNRRVDIILLKKAEKPYIPGLIEKLPESEREKTRDLFFLGLDKYYRQDPKGAIKLWKQIKTSDKELNKEIEKQIKKVEDEKKDKNK